MATILRGILATFLGLMLGGVCVSLIQGISSIMYPMPAEVSQSDPEAMAAWVKTLPVPAFLLVLISWAVGPLVGSAVARILAPNRSLIPPLVVGLFFLVSTVVMLLLLPHPWWMWPMGVLVCLFAPVLGILLAAPKEYVIATRRTIQAPAEKVFRTLASVENFSEAVEGIENIEFLTEQKYGVGTKFRETRIMNGRKATTQLEVTELVENDYVRIVSDEGGMIWDTVFNVEALDGQTETETEMRMQMDVRPHTLAGKLIAPLILGMVGKAVNSDMDAVKAFCSR